MDSFHHLFFDSCNVSLTLHARSVSPLTHIPPMDSLHTLKWWLHENPVMYPFLQRLRGQTWGTFCTSSTDMCIEGYQSSSNSFVYNVFRLLSPELSIGHHTHSVANLKRAVRYNIPTLILYRDPAAAIPSLVARFKPSLEEGVLRYVRFYRYVLDHTDAFILANFEETTQNIVATIQRVEEKSPLAFGAYDAEKIADDAVAHIQDWSERHGVEERMSLPKEERNIQKEILHQRLLTLPMYTEACQTYECLEAVFHGQAQDAA